jgi:hypothetical protein
MEAGLSDRLASENLTTGQVMDILAPYYLSIGMSLDEYWNGDPELVLTYIQAETFRVRKKQREMWFEGIYIHKSIISALDKDTQYFDAPLPDTVEDVEKERNRRKELELKRFKASFMSWVKNPNMNGGGNGEC